MFKRPQFKELASRISEDRNKLQAMVGPRQVGKSTLVKQVLQYLYTSKLLSILTQPTHMTKEYKCAR